MDKIEKIRQEIERQKEINKKLLDGQLKDGCLYALNQVLSFLDTLSGKDARPCWEKVHTYTEELREGDMEKMLLDLSIGKGKRKTKIALPDRVVDALEEKPDKVLEGEVILNGHGLLVDVTKWGNGYKLKVIIKED